MKKSILLAFSLLVSIAAMAVLPENAKQFIATAFPERSILLVESKVNHDVTLDDRTVIEFDTKGNWKEINAEKNGEIPATAVPEQILTTIAKNFGGKRIVKMEYKRVKAIYEVTLEDEVELEFDKTFMLISIND